MIRENPYFDAEQKIANYPDYTEYELTRFSDRIVENPLQFEVAESWESNGRKFVKIAFAEGEVIEEGTDLSEVNLGNMDVGIAILYAWRNWVNETLLAQALKIDGSYERIAEVERENQRIRVQLDLTERANSELVFYDTLDGEPARKMELDTAHTVVKDAISAGATALNVVDASQFQELTEATLYDGSSSEDVLITAISGNVITVQETTNSYGKGAFIARSNAEFDSEQQILKPGRWGTYSISMSESV